MKMVQQLATDLEILQHVNAWIGYNATELLEDVDYELAQWKPHARGSSIWQLVNHISFWREVVTKRLKTRAPYNPQKYGLENVAIMDPAAWQATKQRFEKAYEDLYDAILGLEEVMLSAKLTAEGSYYYNISGCITHDAFHLGQVIQLKRMAQALKKDEQF